MNFNLIIPPNVETAITGFVMSAEKTVRGTVWRFEYWHGENYPRVFRNGDRIASLETCSANTIKLANAATKMVTTIMRGPA
jgi:hypothetical protein